MAALKEESRAMAFEAIEASGESQYPQEHHRGHDGQREEAAAAATEQQQPMTRQSSLLSLTLEEIQNTVCEPGKNFGSMNMDEFLSNIWTAEEGTAMTGAGGGGAGDAGAGGGGSVGGQNHQPGGGPDFASNSGMPPASLYRQGSVSLPATLCRKTVDEVWSEIQRDQQQQQHHPPPPPSQGHMLPQQYQNSGNVPRQPTFGEMTLEDFLIKAGVVRESGYLCCSSPQAPQQQHYAMPGTYPMVTERGSYGAMVAMGYGGDHQNPASTANGVYRNYHQPQGRVGNGYGGGGVGYRGGDGGGGGRVDNGHVGVGSPVSPVSSDGYGGGGSQVDNSGGNAGREWAADGGGRTGTTGGGAGDCAGDRGRKRMLDGPVDKVTERRQRRMIKNRESAARSRARKQAYTVELETELSHLKEENSRLHEEQRRLTARRREMLLESMTERAQTNLRRNAKALRPSSSCVW
uniref:Protein ABSCISIC ACID-INSENSITIVE 5 n=1 Tax=Anthurium amnicola TaxID=1678845 RepID=A0A1D1XXB4_9ARAE